MRSAAALRRAACAVLLAALLGLRLLAPAGFMPAFENGAVTIVACPDTEPVPGLMAHHHHPGDPKVHQQCPYAAGASTSTSAELAQISVAALAAAEAADAFADQAIDRPGLRDRPPSTGPPLPT